MGLWSGPWANNSPLAKRNMGAVLYGHEQHMGPAPRHTSQLQCHARSSAWQPRIQTDRRCHCHLTLRPLDAPIRPRLWTQHVGRLGLAGCVKPHTNHLRKPDHSPPVQGPWTHPSDGRRQIRSLCGTVCARTTRGSGAVSSGRRHLGLGPARCT